MELFKIPDIKVNKNLQIPIKTATIIDELFSLNGGIMPSSITMVPGPSGIGKTTVCIEILKTVKLQNPNNKVLFISIEMNKIHLYRYSKRLNFIDIPILIFDTEQSIVQQLTSVLYKSWDLVLIDSFQQLVNLISVHEKMSSKQAEILLIKIMDKCRLGENKERKNTSFLCTMHMTKANNFAGSAYIKFMVDAMLEIRKDEDNDLLSYMSFSKNRDGKTDVRLYFNITKYGIEYNLGRYKEDKQILKNIKHVNELNQESIDNFDETFKNM